MSLDPNSDGSTSGNSLDNAAKLHALSVQLSETRRDLLRSRTVTRLLRDAYRLDDLSSSVDAIPSRFLMLVTENMLCDCAALLRAETPGGSDYAIVALAGVTAGLGHDILHLEDTSPFVFTLGKDQPNSTVEILLALLKASRLLWTLDVATGHALVLGGKRNATIEHHFCANDYETVEGALAVYIDVLDRRRTRRLLEQAMQESEARNKERDDLVMVMSNKMRAVLDELTDGLTAFSCAPSTSALSANSGIRNMAIALAEARQVVETAQEIFEEKPSSITLSPEWVPLSDLLLSVVRGAQPACTQRNIDLRLTPFSRKFRAYVDRIWIEIILNALLTEAYSCVADGAEMAVEARRREDGSISILISARSRLVSHTSVINETSTNQIVFGQANASIRRLVEAHGAVLTSERPDAATNRFVLSLPSRDCRDK